MLAEPALLLMIMLLSIAVTPDYSWIRLFLI